VSQAKRPSDSEVCNWLFADMWQGSGRQEGKKRAQELGSAIVVDANSLFSKDWAICAVCALCAMRSIIIVGLAGRVAHSGAKSKASGT